MIKLLLAVLVSLASLALAKPTIHDEGFNYFGELEGSYFDLAIEGGELVVTLSNTSSNGAISHTFEEIEREPKKELDAVFAAAVMVAERADTEEDRAVVISNLRRLAGMDELRDGWTVTHDEMSLDEAVAAYNGWFDEAGLTVAFDGSTATPAVRPYDVSGDAIDEDLRVVFAQKGTAVRVYIGPR